MNKLKNINIKEALSLLRLGFDVEQIKDLDKELSSEKKFEAPKPKKAVQRKKTAKKKDDDISVGIKDALLSILSEVKEIGKNPIKI